ncbi:hypothetical protein H5410_018663 [Solanum commersonii]|uniref:Uncharacterized protein n=1 Tax=Solanum commersonii TaxID=4109 RepID=A0A9J6A411_SOLCO|nr:hypothetical protein H5410_018663 [Solanum commersonii]
MNVMKTNHWLCNARILIMKFITPFHLRLYRSKHLWNYIEYVVSTTTISHVMEMQMLRWIYDHTKLDRIKNDHFRQKMKVAHIGNKM